MLIDESYALFLVLVSVSCRIATRITYNYASTLWPY